MISRRSVLLSAALAFCVSATDVLAQAGTVYWKNSTVLPYPSIHHRFAINGTGVSQQFHVYPTETGSPSAADYIGAGKAFFADEFDDTFSPFFAQIPGTNLLNRIPIIMSEDATNYAPVLAVFIGQSPNPVTNPFDAEFMDESDPLWSNDNLDTFLSWQGLRVNFAGPVTPTARVLYRYNGSKTALFGPQHNPSSLGYNPFQPQHAIPGPGQRIVRVTTYGLNTTAVGWDLTGTRVLLQTTTPSGPRTSMFDTGTATTTVLNDPASSGFQLLNPVFSPVENRVFAVMQVGLAGQQQTRALVSFVPTVPAPIIPALTTILQETGPDGLSQFKGPVVSPDGQSLAFTLLRPGKVGTINGIQASLATIGITGGALTPLWNMGLVGPGTLRVNNFEPTGWKPGGPVAAPFVPAPILSAPTAPDDLRSPDAVLSP